MSSPKNVQIPYDLFARIAIYFDCKDMFSPEMVLDIEQKIKSGVWAKIEALERREIFSQYKTSAVGSVEREQLRKKYLDAAGIHSEWRTEKEDPTL